MIEFVAYPKIPRLSREMIVTEKIDGTNGQIYIRPLAEEPLPFEMDILSHLDVESGAYSIRAGSRNRWLLPGKTDNFGFAAWVLDHAKELVEGLGPGRHFGEWWGQGIGRGYGLTEKRFSLFNVSKWADGSSRPACCGVVPVLVEEMDFNSDAIEAALSYLRTCGSLCAPGFMDPEGVVVFHSASGTLFKKTLVGDEKPKGETR